MLEPQDSRGRAVQDGLYQLVLAESAYGPEDWLAWLMRSRNTCAHRPPKLKVRLMTSDAKGRADGLLEAFDRQPGWDAIQAWAALADGDLSDLYLTKDPCAVLEGLVESTTRYCEAIAKKMLDVWNQRRHDPELLVQPGEQWLRLMTERELRFDGYGTEANVPQRGNFFVAPSTGDD